MASLSLHQFAERSPPRRPVALTPSTHRLMCPHYASCPAVLGMLSLWSHHTSMLTFVAGAAEPLASPWLLLLHPAQPDVLQGQACLCLQQDLVGHVVGLLLLCCPVACCCCCCCCACAAALPGAVLLRPLCWPPRRAGPSLQPACSMAGLHGFRTGLEPSCVSAWQVCADNSRDSSRCGTCRNSLVFQALLQLSRVLKHCLSTS